MPIVKYTAHVHPTAFHIAKVAFAVVFAVVFAVAFAVAFANATASTTGKSERHLLFRSTGPALA